MDSPERILVWHTPEKGLYKEREGEGTRGGRGKRGERGREIERRVLGPVTFISRRSKAPFPPVPRLAPCHNITPSHTVGDLARLPKENPQLCFPHFASCGESSYIGGEQTQPTVHQSPPSFRHRQLATLLPSL